MIAEFFGLPGSGKSTQVNLLKEHFPEKIELITFSKKLFSKRNFRNVFSSEFIVFAFKLNRIWIRKLFSIGSGIFSRKCFHDEVKTAFYFASLYLEFMYLRKYAKSDKIYIVDHGLLQCLSSLVWDKETINKRSDPLTEYIADHFSDSVDYIYIAGCGVQETYRRIMARPWPIRLHSHSKDDAADILKNLENLFEKAQKIISEKGKLFFSDNSLDTQEEFKNLCDYFNLQVDK